MFAIRNALARVASPTQGADSPLFYPLLLCGALLALPSVAQEAPAEAAPAEAPPAEAPPAEAPAADDDDILVDDEDEPPPAPVERPKVGIAPLVPVGKATKPLAEQVSQALLEEFREARFEVIPVELSPAREGGGEVDMTQGQDALKKATKSLAKGEGLLKRLSFSRAEKAYTDAIEQLTEAAPAVEDVTPVVQAYLGLAELNARQGLEEKTREALSKAVRANPEYALDPGRYPPLFIRTHAEVRDEVLAEPKGSLVVDGTGKGATVFIDGREMGVAPLAITEVPPGTHFVRVVGEGIGLYGATVEVGSGDEVAVTPGFFEAGASTPTDKLAQNRFDDVAAKELAELAKAQGHIGTIVGVVAKTRSDIPTALLYVDAATGMARRVDVLRFDGDLLNMAIEALQGREEIENAQAKKLFAVVDDEEPLLAGEKGASELEVPSVPLRFDLDVAAADKPKSRSRTRTRRLGGDGGDDEEAGGKAGNNRRLAASGSKGKRQTLKGVDGDDGDPFKKRQQDKQRNRIDEADDEGSFLTNPWLWTGVAAGGVVVAGALAAGAGVGIYVVLIPPTQADINVNLPE